LGVRSLAQIGTREHPAERHADVRPTLVGRCRISGRDKAGCRGAPRPETLARSVRDAMEAPDFISRRARSSRTTFATITSRCSPARAAAGAAQYRSGRILRGAGPNMQCGCRGALFQINHRGECQRDPLAGNQKADRRGLPAQSGRNRRGDDFASLRALIGIPKASKALKNFGVSRRLRARRARKATASFTLWPAMIGRQ
jgi:hypothetical protein